MIFNWLEEEPLEERLVQDGVRILVEVILQILEHKKY
jgi:hypothetical protein